ncbi:hypothetical protein [uncultured Methylobacterium sp.]|uniref:hypothetical protein n=1 Tax=uncultured Methylobacterium sp. TaxID=157278 RepID=UPI002595A9BF|nr:hypothetical protein [uncultured Methylobacterium sp.]
MTDTPDTPRATPAGAPEAAGDEEAFHIPDEIAAALTEFAAVEQLSRGDAVCLILREYLRAKGYLKGMPAA